MNTESRDEALKLFEESPSVNIMIMGLKVGSLGLNIAFANRAILVYGIPNVHQLTSFLLLIGSQ